LRRPDAAVRTLRTAGVVACLTVASVVQGQSITVSGSPGTLHVQTATAGLAPTAVSNSTTTYTLGGLKDVTAKMTAQLNAAMPSGVTLTINVVAPSTGTSVGTVALDATPRDVVTSLTKYKGNETHGISYTLSATAAAGVVPLQTRTVTLTITSAP
jgi:hypothetical protein